MNPFVERHLLSFLHAFAGSTAPLDLALNRYFKIHKSLGAQDRRTMGDAIYTWVRWKGLLEFLYPKDSLTTQVQQSLGLDWEKLKIRKDIPLALRLGVSPYLYEKLCQHYGNEKASELCRILSTPAPIAIRVNTLKISREELKEKLKSRFTVREGTLSSNSLYFSKREPLFSLPEFKQGYFEMQDEGSQQIADLLPVKPGDTVLDYCSGSGGKALSLACRMQNKGQLYLHDIRPSALLEAKKRLKRAGVQNAQMVGPDHMQMSKLIGKCHAVLVDAPCSGSGTLRRNPDQKWKINEALLGRLTALQLEIVSQAAKYVKTGGVLLYATCSLLKEENEAQIQKILNQTSLTLVEPFCTLLPQDQGNDGFFVAKFTKN